MYSKLRRLNDSIHIPWATGKSAVMQRLFNILFAQNDQVIPFYFEISETPQWIADFAKEFFITFIRQYIAFNFSIDTFLEYILSAIDRINDTNGKKIILYMCKHKEKMIKRDKIEQDLNLGMKNGELEKRLKAFVKSDIIEQGTSNFRYQAVSR
ncbi:hypothetical protein MHK_010978 [Candidatus Magnetomorum sp. HK-1]|nr:hypothetical protein MHK_010978 [Candidatus Magnetomorum sp. HK-1]